MAEMGRGRIALALGGGAARGWAHIGVLQALEAAGIRPDIVAGTSMGAVVGGCHATGKLAELEEFARSLTRRRVFGYLDFNLAGSGLISGQRLAAQLEMQLPDQHIEDLDTKFAAVATEIGSGHEVWLSRGRLVDALRASYAIPGIFKPIRIHGRWLFDGALVNPIPVSVCKAYGARYVIAVNVNADMFGRGSLLPELDAHSDDDPTEMNGTPPSTGRSARQLIQRQLFGRADGAPGISSVMLEAFNIVQDRIARSRLAGDPPDTLISPKLGEIGLFDFHRAEESIALGRAATERVIDDIVRELELRRLHATRATEQVGRA
jgi:NTE family protein